VNIPDRKAVRQAVRIRVYALLLKFSPIDLEMNADVQLRGRKNLGFDNRLLRASAIHFTRFVREYDGDPIGPEDMVAQSTAGDVFDLVWSCIPDANKSD
jgi:hypothetical protein